MSENEEKNETNQIELKTIEKLLGYNFTIPSYQRGYRWKPQQVEDLLNDILNFANKENKKNGEFYCLQPIVVKAIPGKLKTELNFPDNKATIKEGSIKIELNDENKTKDFQYDANLNKFIEHNSFEVIDGQQRLTTVYLILKFLKNEKLFSLDYDTRKETTDFLKNSDFSNNNKSDLTIDQHYIKMAWETICKCKWFKEEINKENWKKALLEETQVIWYEPEGLKDDSDSIKIFQRLNIGKIPLTNSELIRALFILKTKDLPPEELNAYKIASEWDFIEQQLHNEDFWNFITLGKPFNGKDYPNKIEILFDLIEEKNNDTAKTNDKYSTFRMYNDWLSGNIKRKDILFYDIPNLWQEVKNYYYRFHEWYIDDELYHLIGYVRFFNLKECSQKDLLEKGNNEKQSNLKIELKKIIKTDLNYDNCDLSELCFGDGKIKKILLLHNIATYERLKLRFPFKRYVETKWDIEHIHSVNDRIINDKINIKQDWINSFILTEKKDGVKEEVIKILTANSKIKEYLKVKDFKDEKKFKNLLKCLIDIAKNESLFPSLVDAFGNGSSDKIENLVLLDSKTNRGYKNAPFIIKQNVIKTKCFNNTEAFIPICTRNAFLKCYNPVIKNMNIWDSEDRKSYIDNLTETLTNYLKIEIKEKNNV